MQVYKQGYGKKHFPLSQTVMRRSIAGDVGEAGHERKTEPTFVPDVNISMVKAPMLAPMSNQINIPRVLRTAPSLLDLKKHGKAIQRKARQCRTCRGNAATKKAVDKHTDSGGALHVSRSS